MATQGEMFVGGSAVRGSSAPFNAFDPTRRVTLDPAFGTASADQLEEACALAHAAAPVFAAASPGNRAALLERIAAGLETSAASIIERALLETGLPEARLRGELARTCGQLRLFARVAREGAWLDARIDHSLPGRSPPRPDIRLVHQPVGPVAVFGASNFPLAFSVAGGDMAAALAAGCPVIVKAHHAHPGTSEEVARVVVAAVADSGLPAGTFAMLFGSGTRTGAALVADRRVMAVGFTGSRSGGTALMAIAAARRQPIPVYAEMSSTNPVVLLPGALAERGGRIATAFAASLTQGAGQFCTNPGVLLALEGPGLKEFLRDVRAALAAIPAATMLTPAINESYQRGVAALAGNLRVRECARGPAGTGLACESRLFETAGADYLADPRLSEEVFGASSLLVRCAGESQLLAILEAMDGQLTASVHASDLDMPIAQALLPLLERRAGRVLFNGFGTGVEVCDAMVHGGPYPATSDGRSTSVGSLAIMRFVRPVSYQDVPAGLLPPSLHDANPWGLSRRVDGVQLPAPSQDSLPGEQQ